MKTTTLLGLISATVATGGMASAAIFQPDSATAGSEFNSNYVIGNAINGTGLPAGFGPDDTHGIYDQGNHWTTRSGALAAGDAWADFSFNAPVTIGTFYMWNHRSDGVASDPGYAITLFTLELFDAADNLLGAPTDTPATPGVFTAQAFGIGPVSGVSRVRLTILENNGSPRYTGVGEVAFDELRVPAPSAAAMLGLVGLMGARRRDR